VGTLHLGDELECKVTLCPPPPLSLREVRDFSVAEATIGEQLTVLGFLALSDVASPSVMSRHLVLPWTDVRKEGEDDHSRTPNLCVFLHGALKVESLCALVELAPKWHGLLSSQADTKKKSSLVLSLFHPSEDDCEAVVPWLGKLEHLGPSQELTTSSGQTDPFPVRCRPSSAANRPSYSSSPVVWIRPASLHSDVQKILRHARKLPEKTQQFYKELNRLKRAALCLGFHELLAGLAATFEKEYTTALPATAHPDCLEQLTHAAKELRYRRRKHLFYLSLIIQFYA